MNLKFKRWHVRIWKNGWEYGNGKSGRWGFWPWRKELTKRLHESMYLRSTRMKFNPKDMPPETLPPDNYPQHYREARDRKALAEVTDAFDYDGRNWAQRFIDGANWAFDYLQPKQNSLGVIVDSKEMDMIHAALKKGQEFKDDATRLQHLLEEATNIFVRDVGTNDWFRRANKELQK